MSLTSWHVISGFRLTNITFACNGAEGNGLHISALSPTVYFANFLVDSVVVQNAGKNGILYEGDVFEFTMSNCNLFDCHQNGCTLAQSHNGIISTVNFMNCFFNQNGAIGMACVNFDGQYGGPTDVRVYGGYARNNKGFGFFYNNGTGAASLHNVGFENNCMGLQPGDPNGAHILAGVGVKLRDCTGYNQGGGATYLLKGWYMTSAYLDGCGHAAHGAMAATGKSRLMSIDGQNTAHVHGRVRRRLRRKAWH